MIKNVVLKDKTVVSIQPINGKEDAEKFQSFINTLIEEGTYLLLDKTITLEQEKQWLQEQIRLQKNGEQIYLKALVNGHLIGNCFAKTGFGRNKKNVNLGIAVAKKWRGKGLGHILIHELIKLSERKWHPKNIYLHVVSSNKKAYKLYESLGFHAVARLPQWFEYKGRYYDEFIMVLNKKFYHKIKK